MTGVERAAEAIAAHEWAWRGLGAVAIALVGWWLCRRVVHVLDRVLGRVEMDAILRGFLRNVVYAIAVVVVLIAALDFAGVPNSSLLAVVGAVGLGVGLAVKDSLANIASGVMLIVLRPFRAGDVVSVAGSEGTVHSVRIFQTHLYTPDNRTIILPNSQITAGPIINYSSRGDRRLDINVGFAYDDDLAAARRALLAAAVAHPRVRREPAPEVVVAELTDTRVGLQLRAWVGANEYNATRVELQEDAWQAFARAGIRNPSPQRQVHVFHHGRADGDVELLPTDSD
jgi:small-conductance mechanosensitive channel